MKGNLVATYTGSANEDATYLKKAFSLAYLKIFSWNFVQSEMHALAN